MLELYHNGMSTCSAKVRIALGAKGLPWESHVLNLRQAEVQRPEYLKLNPDAVVPTLIHDGEVVRESSVIIEYLDEVFPDPPLSPADPLGRARMRCWIVQVDESIHPVVGTLTWALSTANVMRSARGARATMTRFAVCSAARPWLREEGSSIDPA